MAIKKLAGTTMLALGTLWQGSVLAGTLDEVRANGALRIAYREDAPPFSYKTDDAAAPAGFIVDICRAVADGLARQLGLAALNKLYVPVTSVTRFDAITDNKADLLCEATTQTLKRRETISFSIATFVDGASFVIQPSGPKDVKSLDGRKVGVLAGTTTEGDLRRTLAAARLNTEVVLAKTHQEGFDGVARGDIAAYFGDRGILTFLLMKAKAENGLLLADAYLSIEPYALGLRRGDEDFRLAVDRELSRIYRSGEIVKIFSAAFGPMVQPSPVLQGLYATAALPQ
ncbi:amino acid ABC transporter substrate-binding protein [Reyranella sp.]|uniref:amino acid ABC transporter substrate-binding protein n=1 Tax=Reyranella sp. TaxID=1929291 RepID=UPI002F93826A